jgi:hypothetical protein
VPGFTDQHALVFFNSTAQNILFQLWVCADPQCSFAIPGIAASNVFPSTCTLAPTLAGDVCLFISPSASGPAAPAATPVTLTVLGQALVAVSVVLTCVLSIAAVFRKNGGTHVLCFKIPKPASSPPGHSVNNPVAAPQIAEYK